MLCNHAWLPSFVHDHPANLIFHNVNVLLAIIVTLAIVYILTHARKNDEEHDNTFSSEGS